MNRLSSAALLSAALVVYFLCSVVLSTVLPAQSRSVGSPARRTVAFTTREGTDLSFDLSPDGNTIVFDLLGQLWLVPIEGGAARPLTNSISDSAEHTSPRFASDGRSIVFRSDRDGVHQLWQVETSGGLLRRVYSGTSAGQRAHAWSRDGRLAFLQQDTIRVMDLHSSELRTVAVTGLSPYALRDLTWSPDGSTLLFVNASIFSRFGGRIREVGVDGGETRPFAGDSLVGLAPELSPDGSRLAWISRDTSGRAQLWVRESNGSMRMLTSHVDMTRRGVRWTSAGNEILYAADGRLWRISADGGAPREIPFVADVRFERRVPDARKLRFTDPGTRTRARGFQGLALAPDGRTIAMLALGKLWIMNVDRAPRAVHDVPATAAWLAWSPDGGRLLWSAGPGGAEDLFVTTLADRSIRRVTALPGREERASWSHDGRHIVFVHWAQPDPDKPVWEHQGWEVRIRSFAADADSIVALEESIDLGLAPEFIWTFQTIMHLGQETPAWSPTSDAVLLHAAADTARLILTDGGSRTLSGTPARATFLQWLSDSSVVFIRESRLWRGRLDPGAGGVSEPVLLSDDPALYASAAHNGSVLYVSSDGLRIRARDGALRQLGWPLVFTVQPPPHPLLVRNVRLIDGTGKEPAGVSDLLIENGRIARISKGGTLRTPRRGRLIDAAGRTAIPGMIDLHAHLWDDQVLQLVLDHGVTTIRDMGSSIARTAALRDAINAGAMPGPRVVLGGFQFYPRHDSATIASGITQQPHGIEQMQRGLALAEAFGATYAKLRYGSNVWSAATFIDAALDKRMSISSHCELVLPLVAAGIEGMEHLGPACGRGAEGLYGDVQGLLRQSGMWIVPTVTAHSLSLLLRADTAILGSKLDGAPLTPWLNWWSFRSSPFIGMGPRWFTDDSRRGAAALVRAGVMMGTGSDVAAPGWALHVELEEMVNAGMTPLQAISTATGIAARILHAEDEIGTIAVGQRADLVILDADPLVDIRNTRRILHIIKDGREVDRDALRRRDGLRAFPRLAPGKDTQLPQ